MSTPRPLEAEIMKILENAAAQGPMGQHVAEHGLDGFGQAFKALPSDAQEDQVLFSLAGLAQAVQRLAREIDEMERPPDRAVGA
jgi:hypothetical protein